MNEKLGFKELFKIYVFTEEGKYITTINTSNEFQLYDKEIRVRDSIFNMDLIRFLIGKKETEMSDYDVFMREVSPKEIVISNKKKTKKVKLVALGKVRNTEGKDIDCILSFPNSEVYFQNSIRVNGSDPADLSIIFEINEYNEDGDLYGMKFYI